VAVRDIAEEEMMEIVVLICGIMACATVIWVAETQREPRCRVKFDDIDVYAPSVAEAKSVLDRIEKIRRVGEAETES
jgi:hypothetical protein